MTVYSATQFFNELDLLEIRLETLDPVVDYFVISESTKTHSGLDKPLYFNENKDRFRKFENKIIHQIVDYTPDNYDELVEMYNFALYLGGETTQKICKHIFNADWFDKYIDSYLRDTFEKEALLYAFTERHVENNAIVLLGDLDEIPRPSMVNEVIQKIENPDAGKYDGTAIHLQHDMYYYYLNLQKLNEPWHGTFITNLETFKKLGFCYIRTKKPGVKYDSIPNAGWHFTYQGGVEAVKTKVKSWGEQSLNIPYIFGNIEKSIKEALQTKKDLFFRHSEFVARDINNGNFPEYLVNNQDRFKDMIL